MEEPPKPGLDLKSILSLKKPQQVPLNSQPSSPQTSTTPTLRTSNHITATIPPPLFSVERRDSTNTSEESSNESENTNINQQPESNNNNNNNTPPVIKRLSKVRKSIQTDISNGNDNYGALECLKNSIISLCEEITYNNNPEKDEAIRKYVDYLHSIQKAITGSSSRRTRSDNATPLLTSSQDANPQNEQQAQIIYEAYPQPKRVVSAAEKSLIKFIAEEGDYVFELTRIVEEYLQAIQKDQLLSKADEKTIFSVSPELLEFHNYLYVNIKEELKKPDCEVGKLIEDKIGQFNLYQQYSINVADAAQCLERNLKESKNLASVIKQHDKKDQTLLSLLHRPLRRVEEYIFALDAYSKALQPGNKDKAKVDDVIDKLQDILDSIGQRESVADNLARCMEIGNSIVGLDENLVRPDRRFIYEGSIKVFRPDNPKKPIADYGILFNDVFIYCMVSGKSYTYVGRLYMHTITISESSKSNCSIDVTENEKEKYILTALSTEDRDGWIFNMGKVIREVERTRKVFGVPLKVLMKREKDSDIPVIVEKSIKFIYDYGMNKEGIFRQTGRSTQIEKLKDQLNQGAKVFFAENMDVHTVATLFKQWLRELPDPLLTWDSYPDFILAVQQPEDIRDQLFREIIEHLPRENRYVCQHMFKCLQCICENESKTKMNPNNLAVVFAPNILKNADPNANPFDQSHFDRINDVFKTLIVNYQSIFGSVEQERERKESVGLLTTKRSKEKDQNRRSLRVPGSLNFQKLEEGKIIKEGILNFQEKKKWQVRYIILKPQSIQVFGKSSKEKKPKLTLDLAGSQCSSAPSSGKPFSWVLEVPNPVPASYFFAARSSDEQDEWTIGFQAAMTSPS